MPQMSPLYWSYLFSFSILLIFLVMILNHFSFPPNISPFHLNKIHLSKPWNW